MTDKIRELNDFELDNVNGGGHLSSDDVKNLQPGQLLIIEDCMFDLDLAKGRYTGKWKDPGPLSMLEVEVEILEVYEEFTSNHERAVVGRTLWVSRWCVDFFENA